MLFENLNIIDPIKKALKLEGYENPTPIQEQSIPPILNGRDFLGCAQTGTGKTAAFAIPILQLMINKENPKSKSNHIKALILAPTRELAIQIGESFDSYGKYINLKTLVIFGGVSQNPQTNALKSGVDILVATPGRLIDLVNQKFIDLHRVEFFVLDEADCMLDMGMIHDVKRIITKLPVTRQNMLFSATMPNEIKKLVDSILKDPVRVAVAPVSSTIDTVDQSVYFVSKKNKRSLLIHLLEDKSIVSALVFSRTKHGANKITEDLVKSGISAQAIHGNKSQSARQLALSNFKEGKTRVLVATDIAARGIDIDHLSHVINFDLTNVPETHVHRIGRTGRAGLNGIAISFCDEEEFAYLKDIEHLTSKSIPVVEDHPYAISITSPIINNDIKKKTSSNRPSTKKSNSNNNFRKNTRKPKPKRI
ncbi:DNA/RNA helicase, superfamily II [Clostridium putrefaciens]|uniref:ATP-dependent RNA helicase CshA n=1 Tax=Clostridium putrefaciens TaxID=99675 RepID=A0A381JDE8_9CLOT|nr:DEAD/DEAH box helicase [Clostridium putrefaciens]SUY48437.1 DNA/RNA helicase, superfamily II [Clostridium putrefaciens]